MKTRNCEKKKSELWDKKLQLPFFIFHSVAETSFHIGKVLHLGYNDT